MDPLTGSVLFALMLLLAAGVVGIAGAAVREAQLAPGLQPDSKLLTRGRLSMAVGTVLAAVVIWFGSSWWDSESQNYARSIYKPLKLTAVQHEGKLDLKIEFSGWLQPKSVDDFVADHGHLMHLYAVRAPSLDAVYHLHPNRVQPGKFNLQLPAMPAGSYRIFADVVHTSGFPETLTTRIDLPGSSTAPFASPDDAGSLLNLGATLPDGGRVTMHPIPQLIPGRPVTLQFRVEDRDGNPAANLKPYLGMAAHLAVIKKDFSVFSHIHPNGNISMAAYEMAQMSYSTPASDVLVSSHAKGQGGAAVPAEFSFPFGFPSSGNYRLILQFARQERVETVAFDIVVQNLQNSL